MGDFAELIIFLAVVVISLLAGGRKRGQQQRRTTTRPRPPEARPVRREPTAGSAAEPTRQNVAREILDLLGAQLEEQGAPIPAPMATPVEVEALDDYRRDAISLEDTVTEPRALDAIDLSRQREHDAFHERYVDAATEPERRRGPSRYHRLTPRTAREAVIWKTILSPPKAFE